MNHSRKRDYHLTPTRDLNSLYTLELKTETIRCISSHFIIIFRQMDLIALPVYVLLVFLRYIGISFYFTLKYSE